MKLLLQLYFKVCTCGQAVTNLIQKQLEFSWSPECQQAFDALKQKLLDAPVLAIFDPATRSKIWCDTSNFAVGAVLMQQNTPDSPQQPVEYLSKYSNSAECNYSATEHKFVGLIQALHAQRHYLLGRPIAIRTNYVSLYWLISQPYLSYRQVRWLEFMSEFNLTIIHVPRRANIVADALSCHADLHPARVATVSISV